jgi:hypothetical protein
MSRPPATPKPGLLPPLTGTADRLLTVAVRLTEIAVGAALIAAMSMPQFEEWLPLKNIVAAVGAVLLTGKCLYDTLFYDRFWP